MGNKIAVVGPVRGGVCHRNGSSRTHFGIAALNCTALAFAHLGVDRNCAKMRSLLDIVKKDSGHQSEAGQRKKEFYDSLRR
jgi:hypothetical protein